MIRSICELTQGVKFYERGVELYALPTVRGKSSAKAKRRTWKRAKRGCVEGLSVASRRRLREALASARPVACEGKQYSILGLCLTIPNSLGELDEEAASRYAVALSAMFDAWYHRTCRAWPSVGWIWRIELTKKRMPHIHLVGFVPVSELVKTHIEGDPPEDAVASSVGRWLPLLDDCRGLGYVSEDVHFTWKVNKYGWGVTPAVAWDAKEFWLSCLRKHDLWKEEARVRAVDAQLLTSRNCVHYLCDHQSKRKQEQLGWKGRQWGIVNRRALAFNVSSPTDEEKHLYARLTRVLSRCSLTRRYAVSLPSINLDRERPSRRILYIQPRLVGLRGFRPVPYSLDLEGLVHGILSGMFEPVGWKPSEKIDAVKSMPLKFVQEELFNQ